jgi:antitoxin component of MazEF toxin-antitoxin module
MAIQRLQKFGDGVGVTLPQSMLERIGVAPDGSVDVELRDGVVVIAPAPEVAPQMRLSRGRSPESFEAALKSTFEQYDGAMARLANAGGEADHGGGQS